MTTPKKDYYTVLGINKDADESTIKKSFYKLAQKWHPDKNPDNKEEAETKFKEISEAYGILSDTHKKQQYDQFGVCDGEGHDFSHGFPDLSELFGAMGGFPFGAMGGMHGMGGMGGMNGMNGMRGMREKPKPVQEVRIKLKLQEIFNGIEKSIEISIDEMCQGCKGSGSKTGIREECKICNGQGIRILTRQIGPGMISQQTIGCEACNQKGTIINPKNICNNCNGKCVISSKLQKVINITKNFDYETVMLLKNHGNYDPELKVKADINITFKIADFDKYNIVIKNSHDLCMEYPIHISDAFMGYSMYWDSHPDGNLYHFKFHDIIKDGDIKFIKNLGLPNNDTKKNSRGKLFITFKYLYPTNILDYETFKTFIKNKESHSNIVNKDSYIKEKVYDIKEETDKNQNQNHNHNHNHNQQHFQEGEMPNCAQS